MRTAMSIQGDDTLDGIRVGPVVTLDVGGRAVMTRTIVIGRHEISVFSEDADALRVTVGGR